MVDGSSRIRFVSCVLCEREPLGDTFAGGWRAMIDPSPYRYPDPPAAGTRWTIRYGRCDCSGAKGRGVIPTRWPWPRVAVEWAHEENAELAEWQDTREIRPMTDAEREAWRRKYRVEEPPAPTAYALDDDER